MEQAVVRLSFPALLVWLVGLAGGLVVGTITYRWRTGDRLSLPVERVTNWRDYALPERSLADAPTEVTLIVFTDYQCPYCRELHEQVAVLQTEFPGQLGVILRHFPLEERHPFARAAALALECSGDAIRRREMDSVLFANQDSLGRLPWIQFGRRAGVTDTAAFDRCVRQEAHAARIREDIAAARRLGVRGTPTVLVNDLLLRGVGPHEILRGAVRAALGFGRR